MCSISLKDINSDYQIVDIRDSYSFYRSHLKNSINSPNHQINKFDKPIVLICYSGNQAKELAKYYNKHGKECYYLEGGYQGIMNINNKYY